MATNRFRAGIQVGEGGDPDNFKSMASELSGNSRAANRAGSGSSSRGRGGVVGGNPSAYLDLASDLFATRSDQGEGKTVEDKTSFGTEGNPNQFLEMAKQLRSRS